ncbi:MAG: chromosomal replication initiator protein DnaA [Myxococcales bacterium]
MSEPDVSQAWQQISAELRNSVPDTTWRTWLEPLAPARLVDGTLFVEAPDRQRRWVDERFGRLLRSCAASVLGPGTQVEFVAPGAMPHEDLPSRRAVTAEPFNPRLTFDQFVIGDSNRLAHGAALAVAELPGLAYNPLVLCGAPGLGKTHLLQSIANYVTTYGDGLSVRYTTVEGFTNHFVGAVHGGDVEAFKRAYRGVDVLLVDDVQFLQSKVRTEQEFFHTFNALHQAGAQLVLTSDRPPRDLDGMEARLRERFEAGLVCDVRPPDYETRLTILRKRVLQDDVGPVDPAALEAIADRVRDNVRALEGALIRIVAFGSLTSRPVTRELAEDVLGGLYPELGPRRRTLREIQERVCGSFGVSLEELLSTSRAAGVAWPRHVAMYLSRELTDATLPAIGRAFGGRNHTTVLHAHRRTAERIASDPEAYEAVRRLTAALRGDQE